MEINKNLNLILRDVYVYDIKACHYTIMKNLGFDLKGIDPNDKLGRNIKIGKLMRENPRITTLLRTTTKSIINEYILKNNILSNEIILRQYDGIILTRTIHYTHIGEIPLERRKIFQIFIASIDRHKYLALDSEGTVHIKGVAYRYKAMDNLYYKLCKVLEMNKKSMFINLQKIKEEIFYSNDPKLFGIPNKNDTFTIFLKGYGELQISESTLRIMDTNDIDRKRYFQLYLQPFTKSIVFENVR